jgi:hypothetical protein
MLFRGVSPTTVALFVLAVVIYGAGLSWGLPHATAPERDRPWGIDDMTPLGALADMHNIIEPKPDRNLGYPLMSSFMFSAVEAPYLGYLWATGGLSTVSAVYPYGLKDPVGSLKALTWIAHLLTTLLGAGVVVAVYSAGRRLWDSRTGLLAALFTLTSFPMFYYTRTGNVDVPVLFFTALALVAFADILTAGLTTRNTLLLGVAVGCALGTKEPAVASFVGIPLVVLPLHWRRPAAERPASLVSWRYWRLPATAALAAFLAFGLSSGLFVDPERFFAHLAFMRGRVELLAQGNVAFMTSYPRTWDGHVGLARLIVGYLIDAMTLPGLLLSLVGVGWVLWRERLRAAFVLPAVTYLIVLFWQARSAQLRYIMPAALTLAFFAARAVTLAWGSPRGPIRVGAAACAIFVLGLGLLRGVDLTHAMLTDSRYAAAEWLAERAREGDRAEFFGAAVVLPPIPAGVTTARAAEFRGAIYKPRVDDAAAQEIIAGWNARRPAFIITVPDHSSEPGMVHSATCPPQVFAALKAGSIGYRQAAYFQTPSLLPWVRRPLLDYPTVNPPIHIFVPVAGAHSSPN